MGEKKYPYDTGVSELYPNEVKWEDWKDKPVKRMSTHTYNRSYNDPSAEAFRPEFWKSGQFLHEKEFFDEFLYEYQQVLKNDEFEYKDFPQALGTGPDYLAWIDWAEYEMQEGERIPYDEYKSLCRQHPGEYLCGDSWDINRDSHMNVMSEVPGFRLLSGLDKEDIKEISSVVGLPLYAHADNENIYFAVIESDEAKGYVGSGYVGVVEFDKNTNDILQVRGKYGEPLQGDVFNAFNEMKQKDHLTTRKEKEHEKFSRMWNDFHSLAEEKGLSSNENDIDEPEV